MNYIIQAIEPWIGLERATVLVNGFLPGFGLLAFGVVSGAYARYLRGDCIMKAYSNLVQPFFAPPGWLFPVVWPILYMFMGLGLGTIITNDVQYLFNHPKLPMRSFLIVWFILQYAVNFAWSLVYFGCNKIEKTIYLTIILAALVVLMTIVSFCSNYKLAAAYFLPYALWTVFASFLHWQISELNPGI